MERYRAWFWPIAGGLFLTVLIGFAGQGWAAAVYELLTSGLLLVVWLLSAYGWGVMVRLAVRIDRRDALVIVTTIATGLGVMSLGVLGLGLIGAMNQFIAVALLLFGAAAAAASIWRSRGAFTMRVDWPHWLWLSVVPVAAITVLCALLPAGMLWGMDEPNGYDVVSYHLQIPREWYEAGRISGLHHNVYSYFPFNVEMQYLLAMHLMDGPWVAQFLAQLMHTAYTGLAIAAVYAVVRPAGKMLAVAAALLAAAPPWMSMLGSIAYNEGGLLLYGTLAIGWVIRTLTPSPGTPGEGRGEGSVESTSSSPKDQNPHPALYRTTGRGKDWPIQTTGNGKDYVPLLIAGVMAGFAAGCKLTAVPLLMVGLPLSLLIVNRRAWKGIAVFIAAGVMTFSPWLLRNAVWTGNPIFPEMQSVLGRGHFTEEQSARWHRAHKPRADQQAIGVRVQEFARQVWLDWRFAYAILPLGVLAMLLNIRRRESQLLLILLLIATGFWLTMTHLQGRFFVLAIPLAAIAVGVWAKGRVAWALCATAVIAVTIAVPVLSHKLQRLIPNLSVPITYFVGNNQWDLAEEIMKTNPPNLPLVLVGDANAYLYRLPLSRLYYRTPFDVDAGSGGDLFAAYTAAVPNGMVILWVNSSELERFHRTYQLPPPDDSLMSFGVHVPHARLHAVTRLPLPTVPASAPSPSDSGASPQR